ncbi:alpha/beta family hydrolase [Parendozoicomonas haliclonae]|uniref:Alpha/beta hydrolase family protein n=1 Tax=Parendozoicomonas haliclonae TaxID=1960125 RepID=A0A1X7AHT4_9GAMM|nr:alpha/beta family hydrolase [Parendozoicomonas haliclonae]SMA43535.1 Alpha/beta hydrolase family protein [Parendozoicomonas haliclonae]
MNNILWNRAEQPVATLILAHGAGAPMDSTFMETMAERLCRQGITVARFEFAYMAERRVTGKKRPPEKAEKLIPQWLDIIEHIKAESAGMPLFIGGKSMGGRMASLAAKEQPEGIHGVICLGYPFYAIGKPEKPRTAHLLEYPLPVLMVQGERDTMGDFETVMEYKLAPSIQIQWLPDGNHDLKPRKASGFDYEHHLNTTTRAIKNFINTED